MRRMPSRIVGVLSVAVGVAASIANAQGESWLDATLLKLRETEFEFSRAESDVPFIPVVSVSHSEYGRTRFARTDGTGSDVEFRTGNTAGYALLPLHIGRRSLALAVPTASYTRFRFTQGDFADQDVAGISLVLAGAVQTTGGNQWGGFIMPSAYAPLLDNGDWGASGMAGIIGRNLQGERTAWYYGVVYDYSFGDGYFLPYVGFTYTLDPVWVISMIAPWPSVTYAPSKSFNVKAGLAPSGASWVFSRDGEGQVASSIGGWDLGLWANWRLTRIAWVAVGVGVSGLRSLEIGEDGNTHFDPEIESEPWVSLSFNVRPN
jgi:hypothetical protein